MVRVDLHTHSVASPDGGISLGAYETAINLKTLDYIAITDHDRIDFAIEASRKLGDAIIVGEEITTTDGEIIGLYLSELIKPGLSAQETVRMIKEQGGVVYIPHPFETARKGIQIEVLKEIGADVDIVEVYNGRAQFVNKNVLADKWVHENKTAAAASSDAHGRIGWGRTYTELTQRPARESIVQLLSEASLSRRTVGTVGLLYPKLNRLKKKGKK